MKTYQLFTGILFLLLVGSVSTMGYTPEGEGFVQVHTYATTEDRTEVVFGNSVALTTIVHNYWNDTMANLTMFQSVPADTQILSVLGQDITTESVNFTDFSYEDNRSGMTLQVSYLNVTSSNFTLNLESLVLQPDEYFSFDFELNFTTLGQFNIPVPTLSYYDHWGDLQTEIEAVSTSVTMVSEDVDSRTQYIPSFNTVDPNYVLIIGGLLVIFIAALLGRMLHFKAPIEV